ncbi:MULTISPECIES: hypothetical protein [unclassified Streptomyces]|uniref:hypothetical protein n=1 Tax=unclassified Streptomyces TaxID=2593676 RepID=UPI001F04839F|nr:MULTISPECIES: hypothetical protein [unclassified Streptomyces]MCH0566465.1 hypothetical protein [Streptomyces sp. MUM 2J]MCH0571883.1 hypothetical protein [Streptomyces sp. MUM 136J]
MTPTSVVTRAFTGPGGLTRLACGGMLVGTVATQHPNQLFNRVQQLDSMAVLFPNWRFFAPTPARHDYQFLYRTLSVDRETSPWRTVEVIVGRRVWQIVWFPGRRAEKAIFDACQEVILILDDGFSVAEHHPAYRMLREFIRNRINQSGAAGIKGFQFALARAAGYDTSEEPEIVFVSPYVPLRPTPADARGGRAPTAPDGAPS